MPDPIIVAELGKHRSFPYLVDMLAFDAMAVASIGAARQIKLPFDFAASEFECKACNWHLRVNLDGLLTALDTEHFPSRIEYQVCRSLPPPASRPIGGIAALDNRFKCSTFAVFIDRVIEWLKPRNSDFNSWPPLANFARVVRNGIIHGGTINMRSPTSPTVSWLGVEFGHQHAGEAVFSEAFSAGDLVPLLLKLEEELNWLGAPFDLS